MKLFGKINQSRRGEIKELYDKVNDNFRYVYMPFGEKNSRVCKTNKKTFIPYAKKENGLFDQNVESCSIKHNEVSVIIFQHLKQTKRTRYQTNCYGSIFKVMIISQETLTPVC